jgi:hypothetical protein
MNRYDTKRNITVTIEVGSVDPFDAEDVRITVRTIAEPDLALERMADEAVQKTLAACAVSQVRSD